MIKHHPLPATIPFFSLRVSLGASPVALICLFISQIKRCADGVMNLSRWSVYATVTSEPPQMSSESCFWSASFIKPCGDTYTHTRGERRLDDWSWTFPYLFFLLLRVMSRSLWERERWKSTNGTHKNTNRWCCAAPCDYPFSFPTPKYILVALRRNYRVIRTL